MRFLFLCISSIVLGGVIMTLTSRTKTQKLSNDFILIDTKKFPPSSSFVDSPSRSSLPQTSLHQALNRNPLFLLVVVVVDFPLAPFSCPWKFCCYITRTLLYLVNIIPTHVSFSHHLGRRSCRCLRGVCCESEKLKRSLIRILRADADTSSLLSHFSRLGNHLNDLHSKQNARPQPSVKTKLILQL